MKRLLPWLAVLLLCAPAALQAKHLKIKLTTPGTLAEQISEDDRRTTDRLTLSGPLNEADLRFLRALAGGRYDGGKAEGTLRRIDLSKATLASGGGSYMDIGTELTVKSPGTLPPYLFNNTEIEEIVLPESVDTLGEHSLARTRLRRIRLPENAVLLAHSLRSNAELEEVVFPQVTCAINPNALIECPKLQEIHINNVVYIAANSFQNLENLRRWEVRGWLGHMDGWYTVADCPRLERIDFCGPVFSTGGDIVFARCPRLETAVFHDVVWNTNFGKAEDCPAFRGYETQGPVYASSYPDYIPLRPAAGPESDSRYAHNLKEARTIFQETDLPSKDLPDYASQHMASVFFQASLRALRLGDKQEGQDYLDLALAAGYSDWEEFYADSSLIRRMLGAKEISRIEIHFDSVRMQEDYLYILRHTPPYRAEDKAHEPFTYAPPSDSLLRAIRTELRLDSIAGEENDEVAQIKNLMYWLHDKIHHDGSSSWPDCPYNALALIRHAEQENRGYNCRFLAMILNDLYLAMGFPSRFLTCQSKAYDTDGDCHVINMVWSRTLGKWIWMDPSFAAYVTDENGLLLHPGEVRARLISGAPLVLNEDANWNHQSRQTKEDYLENYMAKNLYLLSAHVRSESESESFKRILKTSEVVLTPEGFDYRWGGILTTDSAYFWQAPPQEDSIEVRLTGTVTLSEGSGTGRLLVAESPADLRLGGTREVPVVNNRFDFLLRLPYEQGLVLLADLPGQTGNPAPFFAEAGTTLHIDYSAYGKSHINGGGPLNEAYRAYLRTFEEKREAYRPIEKKLDALERQGRLYSPAGKALAKEWDTKNELYAAGKMDHEAFGAFHERFFRQKDSLEKQKAFYSPAYYALEEKKTAVTESLYRWVREWTAAHPSTLGLYVLNEDLSYYEERLYGHIDSTAILYRSTFAPTLGRHPLAHRFLLDLMGKNMRPGIKYPDYTVTDLQGKMHSLSSLTRGKVALVDLWTWWCSPCRRDSKKIIPLYEEFAPRGFTVVGIAHESGSSEQTRAAVQQDGYPWLQCIDTAAPSEIWQRHGWRYVAGGQILLDKDGTILKIRPTAEEVRKILEAKL